MFWPDHRVRENPYLRLLSRAYAHHGIRVVSPPFAFQRCPRAHADWLHLHWPGWMTTGATEAEVRQKQERVLDVLALARRRGKRLCWTLHNAVPHGGRFYELELAFRRSLASLCDVIHVHFAAAEALLRSDEVAYTGTIVRVPHGSYGATYGEPMNRSAARRALGVPEHGVLLLNTGVLRRNKALDDAFDAVRGRDVSLLVAGKSSDARTTQALRSLAATIPNARLDVKKMAKRDFRRYLSAADAFVLPSAEIFTSGSACLALDFGLPLIGYPVNHLAEYLGEPFFFPVTVEGLGRAIDTASGTDLEAAGRAARHHARRHRWEDVVGPLVTAFRA